MDNRLMSLTAQIVSAHIAANDIDPQALPNFIREVHRALITVGGGAAEQIRAEPVVMARKSVFTDHILCLDCGGSFKMLKRHIAADHQMTPEEYRAKWDLPASYPLVTADYAATRSRLAKDSGLGKQRKSGPSPTGRGLPRP